MNLAEFQIDRFSFRTGKTTNGKVMSQHDCSEVFEQLILHIDRLNIKEIPQTVRP